MIPASKQHVRNPKYPIDTVVLHAMEGTYRGSISWFESTDNIVGAHYCISKTGQVTQCAPDSVKLYHAGSKSRAGMNDRSIGVEQEMYSKDTSYPQAMLDEVVFIVAHLCYNHRIPCDTKHVIQHRDIPGVTHTDCGDWYTEHVYPVVVSRAAEMLADMIESSK